MACPFQASVVQNGQAKKIIIVLRTVFSTKIHEKVLQILIAFYSYKLKLELRIRPGFGFVGPGKMYARKRC